MLLFWSLLVLAMTDDQCHRRKKMMGRGAVGGCGTEEKPLSVSRVPTRSVTKEPANVVQESSRPVDLYSQALKTLSERSPFDSEDISASSIPTLPSGLADYVSKYSDSRKRLKKSHSGTETLSSRKGSASNVWVETEEYFRELTLHDIENLSKESSTDPLATQPCFSIPSPGKVVHINMSSQASLNGENETVASLDSVDVVKEKLKKDEQFMEIDRVGLANVPQEEAICSSAQSSKLSCNGPEWLLAVKDKYLLTTERPSKKRKLLGSDAGFERVLVAQPLKGNPRLCHFCCLGDTGEVLNQLIVCDSCQVSVHKKCYGVQEDVHASWLCSWCKHVNSAVNGSDKAHKPCVLCPNQEGGSKPVHMGNSDSQSAASMNFAHLFCSLWVPQVYVEDTRVMEPIMNITGTKETRNKLVCYLCKGKHGACVRCSNGNCRTSFHPICAREARHRMEIWGKYGSDSIELRAFCSKHSDVQLGKTLSMDRSREMIKAGCRNGDKTVLHVETTNSNPNQSGGNELKEVETLDEGKKREDANSPDSVDFVAVLKKLLDRGKVYLKDVAADIGISSDLLAANLAENNLVPELRSKIVKWLNDHALLGASQKSLKVKIKSSILSNKPDNGSDDGSDAVPVSDSDVPDVVPVKSVPPRRRTKNIRILKDNKVNRSSQEMPVDEVTEGSLVTEDPGGSNKESIPVVTKKSSMAGESFVELHTGCLPESDVTRKSGHAEEATVLEENSNSEVVSSSHVHPFIHKKLMQFQSGILSKTIGAESDGSHPEIHSTDVENSSYPSVCCNQRSSHSSCMDTINKSYGVNLEQLVKARKMGVLELSPEDEVEGELIYYQYRLLENTLATKRVSDGLIWKVVKELPQQIDALRNQRWDSVLVNRYLSELREKKKQGRKEKRHKEAQAVLAAATAAAAASSRVSSLRKDAIDESASQEAPLKVNTSCGRGTSNAQLMPRQKDTVSRMPAGRISSDDQSDSSRKLPRSCDVCRRSETPLIPVLVCSSCKVAVHLDCYRSKVSTGPWFCELCDDLLTSRLPGVLVCGLCGDRNGAFRKSTNGQWVHAFCAEWIFESTFRRGQVCPVEGMESVLKGTDVCCICSRKFGVCIKCNFGHCQTVFHPYCARNIGFYMHTKTNGGKLLHKAYCEKHSSEQRTKAETQKHGSEELRGIKQIRVELERLRLLCERIIKREKLKRELVICSHEILASKRDSAALSRRPGISSESATTSLKGHTDGLNEAFQRSDDVTVDSTLNTDVSPTLHHHIVKLKPTQRAPFSGKQIPHSHRPSSVASRNLLDDGEKRSKPRKHVDTLEKELVMTSDEASLKNQKLPKGYFYVPESSLSKEKKIKDNESSQTLDGDG